MTAIISTDGLYRYELRRRCSHHPGPEVCWVMLNPSIADAETDDHTIRVCRGFSMRWGFSSLVVVNLFAYRSTDPKTLRRVPDPIGPDNDGAIAYAAGMADLIVCAWGNHGRLLNRAALVTQSLATRYRLYCLATSKAGNPKHPARMPSHLDPVVFR